MKTALIAGATGLIGNQLLGILLSNGRYDQVIALVRQPISNHPKLKQVTIDLGNDQAYDGLKADDVFCCLGTTIGQAGSKENFKRVDLTYPSILASAMRKRGATQYLMVSALGAKKTSSIFYNQVKGEVEEVVSQINFNAVHIFRPSLLLGNRKDKRAGEDAAKWFYKVFGFLIPSKYQGVDALKVAKAMSKFAAAEERGIFIHESASLQQY